MKLRFTINYRTEWGQQLMVVLSYKSQDGSLRSTMLAMNTDDGDNWQAETSVVESRRSPIVELTYVYIVADADGNELRREWAIVERCYPIDSSKDYFFADHWRDLPLPSHLYSNAYGVTQHSKSGDSMPSSQQPLFRKTVLFRVSAPQLSASQSLAILGSHPALGSWNPTRFLPMQHVGESDWMLSLNVDWMGLPLEYKYVVIDNDTQQLDAWEDGDNRQLDELPAEGQVLVVYGQPLRLQEKAWRVAGVCVPVFSLRSEHSFGVGDFGDLKLFVDWAAAVGMKVVQLLPVNDTTFSHQWGDSYPYNIVSAFALHPHYICLDDFGPVGNKEQLSALHRQQRELNALAYTDYEAVERVKMAHVRRIFDEQGERTLTSSDFLSWRAANDYWLKPYMAWKMECEPLDDPMAKKLEQQFVAFVQYHLHRQLKSAADHARSLGLFLKGDLPIGVAAQSAETWHHPEFFHLDEQTGAPPDAFSMLGQNWGFPTYNWDAAADDATMDTLQDWMAQRLQHMEQYFDALRIDHVLGFFRIWEIPAIQLFGTMGHFSPALPLTSGDIEYYGLAFRKDFLTKPFINDNVIDRLFGIHANYVREHYLIRKPYNLYELNDEVDTQRKVQALFNDRTDENSLWIRDGLYQLVANVLFIEDEHQPDMYHPRIQAYKEPVFEALSTEERDAYMRLYNNYFYQRHSMFWGKNGYDKLVRLLASTRMLVCAEDLGMLPDCVEPVLNALRILTLEIQLMPKQNGIEFAHLDGNPIRSVATISTHDMAPLRLWWEENGERSQRFFTNMLQKQGRAPRQLPAHLAEEIVARHLYSPSMLCILSLQDWLAMDADLRAKSVREERINVPSDAHNRWQWRMHLNIEKLQEATRFNEKLRTMITRSKR